jgi:hypothetical protein
MRKIISTIHIIRAATPRLSDEELDPLEQDDSDGVSADMMEAYFPWSQEDVLDIKRLIKDRMLEKQRFVLEAFLSGLTHIDVHVTEKYWRYHFNKGIEFIKKELKL